MEKVVTLPVKDILNSILKISNKITDLREVTYKYIDL
jgi:hypothetical protein